MKEDHPRGQEKNQITVNTQVAPKAQDYGDTLKRGRALHALQSPSYNHQC